MRIIAVIPARFGSTRFPGKMLHLIAGKTLLQWVWEGVVASPRVDSTIIATDDERIAETASLFGATVRLTRPDHPSGTDRVAEVAHGLCCDWVLNVQGDEPLISPEVLDPFLDHLNPNFGMATLARPLLDPAHFHDPNVVKVVTGREGTALYFSRSAIPFDRDGVGHVPALQHLGIYAYRPHILQHFVSLPPSELEQAEKLEQLRALQNGIAIQVMTTSFEAIGVDTLEDAERVAPILERRNTLSNS
jgi:3-deoxy-manno-octulosonate cytidylyltransferase (CMP-KDO synthetase)